MITRVVSSLTISRTGLNRSAEATPLFARRSEAAAASLREFDGRTVSWFSIDGGKHRGAIGTA
ncbi:MAG: hypothetical protein ABW211_04460, partial [Acidimicrobiia bacterium]